MDGDQPDYQCEQDADVLKQHAQIVSDPDRHAKAHAHLVQETQDGQTAVDHSHKQMKMRVRKGLKKAFPKAGDSGPTPFEKAGE